MEIGGRVIGAGLSETDRRQHCEIAGVIRTPSDVGSAMKTGGITDIVDALPQGGAHE